VHMLADLVAPGGVLVAARVPTKKALFALLAERAAALSGIPAAVVIDAVLEREKLGTTGFGGGVAIPHGRVDGLTRPQAVVARLDPPVPYDALDGAPVDLAVLLLTAADHGAEHLKTLARLSRALRDRPLLAKLRGAAGADAMFAVLSGEPSVRAA
jgi:PTS system nitrogen regulatory IIA component